MNVTLQKPQNGHLGWLAVATYDHLRFAKLGLTKRGAVRRLRRRIKHEMRLPPAVEIEVPGPYD